MITNPTQHSMERRSHHHDYCRPGTYHITLHVAEGCDSILGTVVGDPMAADGTPDAPRVELSPVGQMVESELLTAIPARYPMVAIDTHVVMPDHLHALVVVTAPLINKAGRSTHLGQVIAGFKYGCTMKYRALLAKVCPAVPPPKVCPAVPPSKVCPAVPPPKVCPAVPPSKVCPAVPPPGVNPSPSPQCPAVPPSKVCPAVPPPGVNPSPSPLCPAVPPPGRVVLFAEGYCDVMPVDTAQLETQRAYIHGNPRSRLLRLSHRDWLTARRAAIPTALTLSALTAYLRRECAPSQATPELLAALAAQLLTQPTPPPQPCPPPPPPAVCPPPQVCPPVPPAGLEKKPCPPLPPAGQELVCDSYGDRSLLERRLLPVVCHRKDKPRFAEQKRRCLEEAANGAVLVSPRIAKGEQEIVDEAVHRGFPVVIIHDNGFPDRYHPSAAQLDRCAAGRLLLVTPWRYRYRPQGEAITVAECKTMNCIAQALCRQKDTWWKDSAPLRPPIVCPPIPSAGLEKKPCPPPPPPQPCLPPQVCPPVPPAGLEKKLCPPPPPPQPCPSPQVCPPIPSAGKSPSGKNPKKE
jgi:hypothetical protein